MPRSFAHIREDKSFLAPARLGIHHDDPGLDSLECSPGLVGIYLK
jgi:hypothetical protein